MVMLDGTLCPIFLNHLLYHDLSKLLKVQLMHFTLNHYKPFSEKYLYLFYKIYVPSSEHEANKGYF